MECSEPQSEQVTKFDVPAAICLAKMVEAVDRNPPGTIIGSAQWLCCLDFARYVLESISPHRNPTPSPKSDGG